MADINVVVEGEVITVTLNAIDIVSGAFASSVFTGDGTIVTFNFTNAFRTGSLLLFKNGIFQEKEAEYTEASDRKSITFTEAPKGASGNRTADKVEARYVVD